MESQDFTELRSMNGLYVGMLTSYELEIFNRACETGYASRIYEGSGGLLGLAKVQVKEMKNPLSSIAGAA